MEKKNNGSWIIFLLIVLFLFGVKGCSSGESQYKKDFENGMQKYYSGGKMTNDEYKAVKGFQDWKAKQGEKTYSEWNR